MDSKTYESSPTGTTYPSGTTYILGIDLGANSCGWALIALQEGEPCGLIDAGARVFEAGTEGDIQSGRDESRNVPRRQARQRRRMLWRTTKRQVKLFRILMHAGLLPQCDPDCAEERHKVINELDRGFARELLPSEETADEKRRLSHLLPYRLRAKALTEPLKPYEIGRASYHLSQRRGFLSNRKAPPKKDEDEGIVKAGISQLGKEMDEAGSDTLGEHFVSLDPEVTRIRKRWTSRKMHEDEFEMIWDKQSEYLPQVLTGELKDRVQRVIFFQRPLKSQKHLIGSCELEKGKKRASQALLCAQRFRYLQKVNDLRVLDGYEQRELTEQERNKLIKELETNGDQTFAGIRKLLKIKNKFNLEAGDEKKLPGNRTSAELITIFGEQRWNEFSPEERDKIVEDLRSFEKEDPLARRGKSAWGLSDEQAKKFSELKLEDKYCNLSRKAILKFLPQLEKGTPYSTAQKKLYPEQWETGEPVETLPPVKKAVAELRNPMVERALTELRKVTNAIVQKYGKPAMIRIELARDLKRPRKEREEISKKQRRNEKERDKAKERIPGEAGMTDPKEWDVEKWRLFEECGGICPYCGKQIGAKELFSGAIDIEHIIPYHRSFDNSFRNKTLSHSDENRNEKRDMIPLEAFGGNPDRWEQILSRVSQFQGHYRDAKLRRFKMTTEEAEKYYLEFPDSDEPYGRQLNDTRYASRLAGDYAGLLYGGRVADRKTRIQVLAGQVTAELRREWDLNPILGGYTQEKRRDDHRHHAIDAVVIALVEPGTVKMLSDAAKRAKKEHRRRFAPIKPPWEGFKDEVERAIEKLVVSHRVNHRVSGPLHEETNYSPPRNEKGEKVKEQEKGDYTHIRKPLEKLSADDINKNIVDSVVREIVAKKLEEIGGDPKKFTNEENLPYRQDKTGRKIPIRKVRIRDKVTTFPVGSGPRERHVTSKENHHVAIYEVTDPRGKVKWEGEVVSLFEAMRRKMAGDPIIRRESTDRKRFLFSLAGGDVIEIDECETKRALYRVRTVWPTGSGPRIAVVQNNDARLKKEILVAKEFKSFMLEPLRKLSCKKVSVSPLGEVRYAND